MIDRYRKELLFCSSYLCTTCKSMAWWQVFQSWYFQCERERSDALLLVEIAHERPAHQRKIVRTLHLLQLFETDARGASVIPDTRVEMQV